MVNSGTRRFLLSLGALRPSLGWLFATALIPGLVLAVVLSYVLYNTERERLEEGSLQTARALLKAIDAELIKTQTTVQALAHAESLQERKLAVFYRHATEALHSTGAGYNIVLSDTRGQQILNTAQPFASALPRHGNPDQLNKVLQSQSPSISDLYTGAVLHRPVISIDVPVMRGDAVAYVLSVGLLPEHFNGLLMEQKLPQGWIAALLDAKRTVVARNLNPEQTVGRQATPDLQAQMDQRTEGTMASHSLEGRPTFIAFAQSPVSQWTLAIGMTRDVLYETLYQQLGLLALSYMAFLLGATLLVGLFTHYLNQAITSLGDAADAAAQGDRNAKALKPGIRQIDRLVDQFNAMQESQKRMEAQVHEMAFYDPLTKLANRRLLRDRLTQTLALSARSHCHGALLFLDLDNFKNLNDTHGHTVGDLLLVEVAERLKACVRNVDTVARFGGDEFVLLINELATDATESQVRIKLIASKILSALAEPYRLTTPGEDPSRTVEHRCTVSIGVTLFLGEETAPDDIIRRADAAMYRAKHDGRNAIRMDDPGDTVSTSPH